MQVFVQGSEPVSSAYVEIDNLFWIGDRAGPARSGAACARAATSVNRFPEILTGVQAPKTHTLSKRPPQTWPVLIYFVKASASKKIHSHPNPQQQ
ncbi:hypothetical protein [Acrocarpospora pleiomorpha]|uniref:hypothetical protein n=1 Tax=Acrocarpospora pleiomorpha TaxID=90975 RepID=UPI0012D2FC6B|nr:hypothetical protein [Acrocarpospora pleiomorpha]